MRVRVTGQRLARRIQWRRLDPIERSDLRAVEHRHALEQQPRPARVGARVGVVVSTWLDRHRRDEPDRLLTLAHAIPQLKPGLEPGDECRVRTGQRNEQLIVEGQPREPAPCADAHPSLPPFGGCRVASLRLGRLPRCGPMAVRHRGSSEGTARLSQYPWETEVREDAVAAEPGDRGDLLTF
jgi:hypothetical protein